MKKKDEKKMISVRLLEDNQIIIIHKYKLSFPNYMYIPVP